MGLNHMHGRVQDAITGRFLSADPNIPDPTTAQSYNRYSYVTNNPLSFTDPSGFAGICAPGACKSISGWTPYSSGHQERCRSCMTVDPGALGPNFTAGISSGDGFSFNNPDSSGGDLDASASALLDAAVAGVIAADAAAISADASASIASDVAQLAASNQGGASAGADSSQGDDAANFTPPTPATASGTIGCGNLACSFQMGPFVTQSGREGTWLQLDVTGGSGAGQWVQTVHDNLTNSYNTDTSPATDPYYPYGSGNEFYDAPSRLPPSSWENPSASVSWTAQTSYLLPNQGAAFTVTWGFTISASGPAVPVPPTVVITPWPAQQQLITRGAQ
jgi:hypothetical protein